MALDPLTLVGRWAVSENMVESAVPLGAAAACWFLTYSMLGAPAYARPYTGLELAALLGTCAAVTGWAVARQASLLGRRRHNGVLFLPIFIGFLAVTGVQRGVTSGFSKTCSGTLKGSIVKISGFGEEPEELKACQITAVPGNAYLPGTLILPAWNGDITFSLGFWLFACNFLGALAFRDVRLRPSKLAESLYEKLRLAPGAGSTSAVEGVGRNGSVQACGNPTLWGEPCGQLYNGEKEFSPGEWCIRCQQIYRRNERDITLTVVSLTSTDIDVLNGLERLDTTSWDRGRRKDPDPRISGEERWAVLGAVTLPDVMPISQVLALVHERLGEWGGASDPRVRKAATIAAKRGSRICAWLWFGRVTQQLTDARPTTDVRFAVGPMRLRDLVPESADQVVLQLDVGLLPLELRTAFRMVDMNGNVRAQNSKYIVWVPVAPAKSPAGLWVDRMEGEALRTWIGTERLRADSARGTSVPIAYFPYLEPPQPEAPAQEGPGSVDLPESTDPNILAAHVRVPEPKPAPPSPPMELPDPAKEKIPRAGSLDFVRVPLTDSGEVVVDDQGHPMRSAGDSVAEWMWFEWEQIQLLRQQALVLVDTGR